MKSRPATILKSTVCFVALIIASLFVARLSSINQDRNSRLTRLTSVAANADETIATTTGTIEKPVEVVQKSPANNSTELRCLVNEGVKIKHLVKAGTRVERGDLLVDFDDSVLLEKLLIQKLQVAKDQAGVIQIESDIAALTRSRAEYEQGTFEERKAQMLVELNEANERLQRCEGVLKFSRKMVARGYLSHMQLRADEFATQQAREKRNILSQKFDSLLHLTRARMQQYHAGELAKNQAKLAVAQSTLALAQHRQNVIEEQIANCKIFAPHAGLVQLAAELRQPLDSISMLAGPTVRPGQTVVLLCAG